MPDASMLWTGPVVSPRRYEVAREAVAEATAGGEGLVYRARDTGRDVEVALKLLTVLTVADYGRILERSVPFTLIEHPNLMSHVEVFIGTALTADPTPDIEDFDVIYTVADWVDGQPLSDVANTVGTDQLLGYVAGVGRGLHALHRHRSEDAPLGIVHRDVKPSNVRITPDGGPVLIDFGVARPLDHGDLTQGVGTYRWRAPEVLSGSGAITTAVDVWGLGAIAYWALAGDPPGLDGAAAAREQLTHTPRGRQLADPIGVASHIATLLETDPTRRPADLARWATQLDTILTGRRRRSAWKRPTAVTAVALMAIPGVVLLVDTADDDPGAAASDTTTVSVPSTTGSDAVDSSPPVHSLVPAVGELWEVACLGQPSSMIVSGAEPGQTVTLAVEYAPGATRLSERPASWVTGFDGSTGPALAPGTRRIGPPEVVADDTGSFVVEWHCDRADVGVPMVLTLSGVGRTPAVVRVESRDELVGLEIAIATNTEGPIGAPRLTAGTDYQLDVIPKLTDRGQAAMTVSGSAATGRNFDHRLVVTSSDPSVASVAEEAGGFWVVRAVAPGTAVVEARIAGTDHVATTEIEVVAPPEVPSLVEGQFELGSVSNYLARVLNAVTVESLEATTNPMAHRYPQFLSECGDLQAFDSPAWLEAVLVAVEGSPAGLGWATIYVHTFTDTVSASAWASAFRDASEQRLGRDCVLLGDPLAVVDSVTEVDEAEYVLGLAQIDDALSVTSAHNVVVVALAGRDTLTELRSALATSLSLPST